MKAGLDKAGFFIVLKDGVSGALDKTLRIENAAAALNKAGFCPTLGKLCLVLWQIPLTVFLQSATSMPDTKGPF